MKNKKLAMATAIGLGVLTGTAAQAVQTKMTITGSVIDVKGGTNSKDDGLNSVWGSNLYPNQAKDRITNDDNGKAITIDLTFDSAIFGSYVTADFQHGHKYEVKNSPVVTTSIKLNNTTHQFTSEFTRNFYDNGLQFKNGQNISNNTPDIFGVVVSAAEGAYSLPAEVFNMALSFADGSTPILQNISMAKASSFSPESTFTTLTHFLYRTGYNNSTHQWDYNSDVFFAANSISIAPVPEPETWAMMLLGLGVVGYAARRRAAR